jgi:thiol-disulfide isomerase/thioredoxin
MRRATILLAIWGAALCGAPPRDESLHELPRISVRVNAGESVNLADWKGKVVVVTFWASWCPHCRDEMLASQRIVEAFRDDVRILAIGVDQGGWRTITPFLRQHNIRLPVALAEKHILHAFRFRDGLPSVPQTFFFDRTGRLRVHISSALNQEAFTRALGICGVE